MVHKGVHCILVMAPRIQQNNRSVEFGQREGFVGNQWFFESCENVIAFCVDCGTMHLPRRGIGLV